MTEFKSLKHRSPRYVSERSPSPTHPACTYLCSQDGYGTLPMPLSELCALSWTCFEIDCLAKHLCVGQLKHDWRYLIFSFSSFGS